MEVFLRRLSSLTARRKTSRRWATGLRAWISTKCWLFRADWSHTTEVACTVLKALRTGYLPQTAYNSYIKLTKEQRFHEHTLTDKKKAGKKMARA
ncbi:MAG: hypothetical protein ACK5IQ_10145, partial [Bacteroidales bacterium]